MFLSSKALAWMWRSVLSSAFELRVHHGFTLALGGLLSIITWATLRGFTCVALIDRVVESWLQIPSPALLDFFKYLDLAMLAINISAHLLPRPKQKIFSWLRW
ncbi:hypothetical protein FPV67DRAFT_1503218, partial [Lyophyllum atratum]